MSLRNFLSSRTGKRFYNFCYCWGACLVILGAISKIGDFPYGNILLGIGLYTEVFIFFISGFDEPTREYKWERVFPILNDKLANTDPKVASVNFKLSGNGENYKQEMVPEGAIVIENHNGNETVMINEKKGKTAIIIN